VRPQPTEFRARPLLWWQIRPGVSTLTAHVTYQVRHGQLFQLRLALPAGWETDRVELVPAGLLRGWAVSQEQGRAVLTMDLRRPLSPESSAGAPGPPVQVRAQFHQLTLSPEARGGRTLPFPVVVPLGAQQTDGLYGVSADAVFQAEADTPAPAQTAGVPGPWGTVTTDLAFRYQGVPPAGGLRLRWRPTRLDVRCQTEIVLAPERAALTARLRLEPRVGAPSAIDLAVSAPRAGAWNWKTVRGPNQVRAVQREYCPDVAAGLALFRPQGVHAALLLAAPARRPEVWRLTFDRPLHAPLLLQATGTFAGAAVATAGAAEAPALRFPVPLIRVLNAGVLDGEVSIQLAGLGVDHMAAQNVWEAGAASPAHPRIWRSFRYANEPPVLELTARRTGAAGALPDAADPLVGPAELTTSVEPGRLLHRYRFVIENWPQRSLPVLLPGGARCLAARVDGCWASQPGQTAAGGGDVLHLPVPAPAPGRHRFELVYQTAAPAWSYWATVAAPAPELPVRHTSLRRTWRLPPGVAPLHGERMSRLPDPRFEDGGSDTGEQGAEPKRRLAELDFGAAGTEWEPWAGTADVESLTVVRADAAPAAGLALAAALGLAYGWFLRAHPRLRAGFLLTWLTAAGLALLWVPAALQPLAWYPLFAGGAFATATCLRRPAGSPRPAAVASAQALALLSAALVPGPLAPAADPGPSAVYILGRPGDASDKQTVLAPPELLKQLRDLGRRGAGELGPPVLVAARYEGTIRGASADFQAEFRAYHCGDAPASLPLPLGGVQLRDATCDGTECSFVALRVPRERYAVPLRGRGWHTVLLRFGVPVQANGDERDLRFTAPEVVQSRLVLTAPADARSLHMPTARGTQAVSPAADANRTPERPQRLEADLGPSGTVQVRWRQGASQHAVPAVRVQEAYLWELRPTGSSLSAVLQYAVAGGTATELYLDVPADLEVRGVEAGRLPGLAPDVPTPRLKDWSLTAAGGRHQLRLDFYRPVREGVQVAVECVPRRPLNSPLALPLPVPRATQTTAGLLAYRAEGVRPRLVRHLGINGDARNEFVRFWRSAGLDDPGPGLHAYSFVRGAGIPYVQLALEAPVTDVECTQQVAWHVGPRRADLAAAAELSSPRRDLCLVEWDVPAAVRGLDVWGPDVRTAARHGGRVQIWLRRPVERVEVHVTGWLPLPPGPPPTTFRPPPLHLRSARCRAVSVDVTPAGGVTLEPARLRGLTPLPDARRPGQGLQFIAQGQDYDGDFVVGRQPAPPEARTLTFAEVRDHGLWVTAAVELRPRLGGLRTFTVRIQDWGGPELRWEAAGVDVRPANPHDPARPAWTVTLPEGHRDVVWLRVSGKLPFAGTNGCRLPDLQLEGVAARERWVALIGRELEADAAEGLTPLGDPAAALQGWPAEAERVRRAGTAWKLSAAKWRLRMRPSAGAPAAAAVQVFLGEHAAAVADGQRWGHRATYRLYHDAGASLTIQLPEAARLLEASLDGAELAPASRQGRVSFLLPGQGGSRVLALAWVYAEGRERLDRPDLTLPALEGVTEFPVIGLIRVPAGYRPGSPRGTAADSFTANEFVRAEAELRLSERLAVLAQAAPGADAAADLLAAQQRFFRACRQIMYRGRGEPAAAERLRGLKERNRQLAEKLGYEAVEAQAEREAGRPAPPRRGPESFPFDAIAGGLPVYFAGASGAHVPEFALNSIRSQALAQAAEKSALLALVVAAVGAFALARRTSPWAAAAWPELMVGCAGAGWALFGPGWSFLAFGLLGISGRAAATGRWLRDRLPRRRAASAEPRP
jgi:hypothetical protein